MVMVHIRNEFKGKIESNNKIFAWPQTLAQSCGSYIFLQNLEKSSIMDSLCQSSHELWMQNIGGQNASINSHNHQQTLYGVGMKHPTSMLYWIFAARGTSFS